jgi:RNA polymerase subunit RPABC4/transcription elongation factor Spt4
MTVRTCSRCKRYVEVPDKKRICLECEKEITPKKKNMSLLVIDMDQLALTYTSGLFVPKEEWIGIKHKIDRFYTTKTYEDIEKLNEIIAADKRREKSRLESLDGQGYIYLLKMLDAFFKIGLSRNPDHRIIGIGTGLPFTITKIHEFRCPKTNSIESMLHKLFEDKREKGEWFRLSQEDVEWLKSFEDDMKYVTLVSKITRYMEKRGVI